MISTTGGKRAIGHLLAETIPKSEATLASCLLPCRPMNARSTRCNVLVVDDDPMVRETVTMVLLIDGHSISGAASGPDALSLLQQGKFDVVVTDYFMPAMRGDELAAAIKQRFPSQHIVMLTAYGEQLRTARQPLGDIDLMIRKPFDINALRDAVARYRPVPKQ
jgi:CheY-like chemotaxis protein